MAPVVHLDTHVAAWLYLGDLKRLKPVWKTLERSALIISPIVLLELQYLYEIGRATEPAEVVMTDLFDRVGLCLSDAPFSQIMQQALRQTWTRDPFDRLMVGNALVESRPLLTADKTILVHCRLARWR